jgi:microcompartment protein CcmK/EutM
MRIGIVRGCVVLSRSVESLKGIRLLVVEPVTAENLATGSPEGGGKALIVADQMAPARGQSIAFTEGREAANPYWPLNVPVDATSALIVDSVDFRPPFKNGTVGDERF